MPSGRDGVGNEGGGSCGPDNSSCPDGDSRGNRGGSGSNNGGDNGGNDAPPPPRDTGQDIESQGSFNSREVTENFSNDYVPVGQVSSARFAGQSGLIERGYETNALDVIGETWGSNYGQNNLSSSQDNNDYGADEPSEFSIGFSGKALSIKFETEISINTDGVFKGSVGGGALGANGKLEGSADIDYEDGEFSTKDESFDADSGVGDYKSTADFFEDVLSVGFSGNGVFSGFVLDGGINLGVSVDNYIGFQGDIYGNAELGKMDAWAGYDTVVGYNREEEFFGGETNYKAGVNAFGYSADLEYTDKNIVYVPPILIDLNGDGVELVSLDESTAFFDYDADSYQENLGWVGPEDGILAIDLDGDQMVTQAAEFVFADQTDNPDDTDLAAFSALYDSNMDGVFNAEDATFTQAGIWQDYNQNGQADAGEFHDLSTHNISAINLTSDEVRREVDGNIIHGTGSYVMADGSEGELLDVSFAASVFGYKETADGLEFETPEGTNAQFVSEHSELDEGAGSFVVNGSEENDYIHQFGAGDVVLSGKAGEDVLIGGSGNDWLSGDAGADLLVGGAGHDILLTDGEDVLDGGDGYDVALMFGDGALNLDLAATAIEAAYGDEGNDTLNASKADYDVNLDGNIMKATFTEHNAILI